MNILWLTNVALPEASKLLNEKPIPFGGWLVNASLALSELSEQDNISLSVAFPQKEISKIKILKGEKINNMRGRKKTEERLPRLTQDIKDIAEPQCQTDPQFKSTRLYTRLTICEIRKQLINQKGYHDCDLPTNQTLNTIVNNLGYLLKIVQKTKPLKKLPETDTIFENLKD